MGLGLINEVKAWSGEEEFSESCSVIKELCMLLHVISKAVYERFEILKTMLRVVMADLHEGLSSRARWAVICAN